MKDPYVQENGTLKNFLGIKSYEELRKAEKDIAFVKMLNADTAFDGKCDIDLLKSIHKHIFEDIYEWAGEFRKVPIYKEEIVLPRVSLEYAPHKEIPKRLNTTLNEMNLANWNELSLDELVKQFTSYLSKVWRIHPFRDGNTRTTLSFAGVFAKEHGFELDMSTLLDDLGRIVDENTGEVKRWCIRDKFVLASLDERDYPEPQALEAVIKKAIISGGKIKEEKDNELDR